MKPLCEQTKLERATTIAEAFVDLQRVSWQSTWPFGFCFNASLLLAPLIRAPLEWQVVVVVGTVLGGSPHAWVETPDGDIIDSTFGMFIPGPALHVLPAAQAARHEHTSEVRLTIPQENRYRAAIWPSSDSGWDPAVDVMTLFGPHPHISPALKL